MGGIQNSALFFKDKPVFGLDIGFSTVKIIQIEHTGNKYHVVGYGVGKFDSRAVKDGVIVEPEKLAEAVDELFKNGIVGRITTRRVVTTIPATRTFTKTMTLPPISDEELTEAVNLEAEQYIPMPLGELYLDYNLINKTDKNMEVLAVAAPKVIVDSHLDLIKILGLEPVAFDTSIGAAGRLFESQNRHNDIPAVLIDFGSVSADITIHDNTVIVTSTVPCGGDNFTDKIAKGLKVSDQEAHIIKTKYGITKSKKQKEILQALQPDLNQLEKEIKRMIRYYEERSGSKNKIGQLVTMGGGANMPGLSDYLTSVLRLPVRMCDPWADLHLGHLRPPTDAEKSMYVTSTGLALVETKELFAK
jgi:type IV pilus assembly protein PilM